MTRKSISKDTTAASDPLLSELAAGVRDGMAQAINKLPNVEAIVVGCVMIFVCWGVVALVEKKTNQEKQTK